MTETSPKPAAPYGDFQLEIYLAGARIFLLQAREGR
jgi:hypothetical protein